MSMSMLINTIVVLIIQTSDLGNAQDDVKATTGQTMGGDAARVETLITYVNNQVQAGLQNVCCSLIHQHQL